MNRLNVKPVSGRLVRHPETGEPLPAGGLAVPRSPYWLRRLKGGDVTLATPDTGKAVKHGD